MTKTNNKTLGKMGEDSALEYLKKHGYQILGRNMRPGRVEVDILAGRDDVIAVVEVKCRKSPLVHPSHSVGAAKRARLARAARALTESYPQKSIRFDVICVIACNGGFQIEHLMDAFRIAASFADESF